MTSLGNGRPLTGARIETRAALASSPNFTGRPLTGARIETAPAVLAGAFL